MVRKKTYFFAFICWMVFISILSLASFEDVDTPTIDLPQFDKVVHFFFYFIAAVLGLLSFKILRKGKQVSVILGLLVLYGILIEVLQYKYIPERSGEIWDIFANSLGVISGAGFVFFNFYRKSPLK